MTRVCNTIRRSNLYLCSFIQRERSVFVDEQPMMMIRVILCVVAVAAATHAASIDCTKTLISGGMSKNFNETVAHAIHSMTVQGLRMFSKHASEDNNVPTVNHDLSGVKLVRPYAPNDLLGSDFRTHSMNTIDKILSNLGKPTDGLGDNWSPIERVVHNFHMWDLWTRILDVYKTMEKTTPSDSVCRCLLDTRRNGIHKAVQWVADHYKTGTPITLLNRSIPKLADAASWAIWKDRLLHYYTLPALTDAATYLHCVNTAI
ncbi:uncharacterized protein LOC124122415 [Haliotis rufescens]|uniref:uncharacterized protein LOC124122415 n=1 Tax=Haliotis rufescens TaxID=6454 RepID=UPI00201ECE37|nr:uncharacterized protein LOC124122415 [Haliotis rufescens]